MVEPKHPFAFPAYRYFWSARIMALLGSSATTVALGWLVYDVARQSMGVKEAALRLGLVGLLQFLPILFFSPVAGLVADRFDRRITVRIALGLQFCATGFLAWLIYNQQASIMALYGLAVILSVIRAFFMPALSALATELVPKDVLPRAIALNSVASEIGTIAGPALGGLALAFAPWSAFAVSSTLTLVALVFHLFIGPTGVHARKLDATPLTLMTEGFRYVLSNRLLLGAVSLDLFSVLLGGVTALMPVFARDILSVGPEGLGMMRSAPAVGALAMAFGLSLFPMADRIGFRLFAAVSIFGVSIIGFGLSRNLVLSLTCLAVLGAADMVSVYVRQSLVQIFTPDEMRGRVGAVSMLFISASNELGELESGLLAAALGPVGAVLFGGASVLVVVALWARLFPELSDVKRIDVLN